MGTVLGEADVELQLLVHAAAAEVIYRLYTAPNYGWDEWRTVNGHNGLVSDSWSFWRDQYTRELIELEGVRTARALLADALQKVPEFGNTPVCVSIGNQKEDRNTLVFTVPNIIYGPAD